MLLIAIIAKMDHVHPSGTPVQDGIELYLRPSITGIRDIRDNEHTKGQGVPRNSHTVHEQGSG